jgi:hypothetical protein
LFATVEASQSFVAWDDFVAQAFKQAWHEAQKHSKKAATKAIEIIPNPSTLE